MNIELTITDIKDIIEALKKLPFDVRRAERIRKLEKALRTRGRPSKKQDETLF